MDNSREFRNKSLRMQQVRTADSNANLEKDREPENNTNNSCIDNYMKLNFFDSLLAENNGAEGTSTQFTELFCDFPVSYATTEVLTATHFAKHNLTTKPPPQPPPTYCDSLPPTPPPISQLPKRDTRLQQLSNANISVSAPASPSRGKVVLSKKERKEISKLHKLLDRNETASNTSINLGHLEAAGELLTTHSETNTYKGRVQELKNCLAKINSKVLFGSLNRSMHRSNAAQEEVVTVNEELLLPPPPPPAPDVSPPNLSSNLSNNNNVNNNNDDDDEQNYSNKLKNIPVRQRKVHTSHMENYCLFDPVDFINDKALRKRNVRCSQQQVVELRDPLFSSRQSLEFKDEELVPEVVYDNKVMSEVEKQNFDHHNYFVIDPEDYEKEKKFEINLPNKKSNQLSNDILRLEQVEKEKENVLQLSKSVEHLLTKEREGSAIVKSISQESKDIDVTLPPPGLVESSSSAASALTTSSTSATSTQQATLQRTKKKLTFLSLSPFRSSPSTKNQSNYNDNKTITQAEEEQMSENKSIERAVSELVSSDHMLHLQQMLLSSKENMRSRTVPIESNYVLFNPGPVPSRNVPYKVRKPRPLSTNSDADSGFLSPCSPDEMSSLKSNPTILVLQQCDSVQGYIEVRGYIKN